VAPFFRVHRPAQQGQQSGSRVGAVRSLRPFAIPEYTVLSPTLSLTMDRRGHQGCCRVVCWRTCTIGLPCCPYHLDAWADLLNPSNGS
jgi:hypothetical protein